MNSKEIREVLSECGAEITRALEMAHGADDSETMDRIYELLDKVDNARASLDSVTRPEFCYSDYLYSKLKL